MGWVESVETWQEVCVCENRSHDNVWNVNVTGVVDTRNAA